MYICIGVCICIRTNETCSKLNKLLPGLELWGKACGADSIFFMRCLFELFTSEPKPSMTKTKPPSTTYPLKISAPARRAYRN